MTAYLQVTFVVRRVPNVLVESASAVASTADSIPMGNAADQQVYQIVHSRNLH